MPLVNPQTDNKYCAQWHQSSVWYFTTTIGLAWQQLPGCLSSYLLGSRFFSVQVRCRMSDSSVLGLTRITNSWFRGRWTYNTTQKYWYMNGHIKSSISQNHIMTFGVTVYAMCVYWDGFIAELISAVMHLIVTGSRTWTKYCGWVVASVSFGFSPLEHSV